jgi:hypothetical protein
MWRRVDPVWTDVSEERIASIFRAEKSESEEQARAGGYILQWAAPPIFIALEKRGCCIRPWFIYCIPNAPWSTLGCPSFDLYAMTARNLKGNKTKKYLIQ